MTLRGSSAKKGALILTTFFVAAFCLCFSSPAAAQVTGATLSGTVTDPSGSIIAGAEVAIRNMGTGIVRTVTTDSAGLYSAPNLIPGTYEVSVSAAGFSKAVESNLTLSVGQQQSLNMAMKVGQSSQTVTVEGSAPTVELTSATLSAQVNATTVRELPLNGRDWTQLATLQPGVNTVRTQASTSSPTTNRANRGFGNQLTDSGHSPYENSYRVNGININDYTNGSPGSVIGANLGTDAIQEFSVLTTDYTAEYGRTSGAVINSITKSGTNDFHGTAFGFLRNASLDAKNYFDSKTKPIPPFERYQYGGAIGGPIVKNKTFFFGAYEGVEQHRSNTVNITVPSAASRAAAVPLVQPYLAFWPLAPAGTPLSPDGSTQTFPTTGLLVLHENYATVRVDHHISDSDTLSGTWLFDRGPYSQPDPLLNVTSSLFSYRQMYDIEETHIFSTSLVNTARFGYSRSHGINGGVVGAINPIAANTSLGVRPGIASPIVAFGSGGVTPIASVGSASQNFLVSNSFQFYDDAFWTKGAHSLKFGVSVERIQFNAATLQRPNGQFTFSTLQAFLNDVPSKVQELQPGNAFEVGSRNTAFGFYAQDDWKMKPNLSINIGLRYEPVSLPSEASGRFAVLTSLSPSVIGTELPTALPHLWFGNPTLKNLEPRLGFSWDPFKDGKTAVRGGFGMFDVLPIPWTYTQTLPAQFPFTNQVSASGLSGPSAACPNGDFPVVCSKVFTSASSNVVYVPQNPPQAYAMNWNLNIQRQITSNLRVTLGYVGSRSIHLPDLPDNINYQLPTLTAGGYLFPANSVGKLDGSVGSMRARLWDNSGWYHGLQAGVTKQISHGLQLQGSYTWSKCEDTGSNMAFNDPFQNSVPDYFYFDHRLTKGLCDYNISQNGVVSFIYTIPTIGSKSGYVSQIVGGWQVGTIITAQSGSPFTPVIGNDPYLRATGDANQAYVSTVPGCNPINSNWKAAGPQGLQYLNLNCFTLANVPASMAAQCTPTTPATAYSAPAKPAPVGQVYCPNAIGNLGRNQIVGPGLFDMDFSVFKNFRINERITTQFRVEMFNVLNHPSFLPPLNNEAIFNLNGSVANNAAVVDTTADDPRQIQFGVKINF
jgi:Carboxypeptidase regulatory-like domain/TonB dependent receptor